MPKCLVSKTISLIMIYAGLRWRDMEQIKNKNGEEE